MIYLVAYSLILIGSIQFICAYVKEAADNPVLETFELCMGVATCTGGVAVLNFVERLHALCL